MRNSNKKIISLFFILLGLIPLLFALFVVIKKADIRFRMREKMETGSLETVIIPEDKVVWMDKHEIWVNNHMFDIVSKKLESGIYTFTGLYDEEETMLVEKERTAAEENSDHSQVLGELFKYLPDYCPQSDIKADPDFYIIRRYPLTSQGPVDQYTEILTPPPNART